jgi:hypothetical protein
VRFASVKLVVAWSVPADVVCVASTVYCATNVVGRSNESVMLPPESGVTSAVCCHVWPMASFTTMCTASPGCQLAPVSVTVAPGA